MTNRKLATEVGELRSTNGRARPGFTVDAVRPIAFDSPDHVMPHGTKRDNSRNPLFNRKLWLLFPNRKLALLDVGCAGGGFVKSCLEDGHLAIGLEGSDYSLKRQRAEWATIPENLFTCDITADFRVRNGASNEGPVSFQIVTAWEVMEHIRTRDLPKVCENIKQHLAPGGIWIMSIAPIEDVINGVQLHQTVQNREWWVRIFADHGFENHPELERYFGDDWVRGRLQGAPLSFHLVLTRKGEAPPPLPAKPVRLRLAAASAARNTPAMFRLLKASARDCVSSVLRPARPGA